MRNKIIFFGAFFLFSTFFFSLPIVHQALAQAQKQSAVDTLVYPIAELGQCQSKGACKTYCDKPENSEACLNFAEKNKLMSAEETAKARAFAKVGKKGPGGCTDGNSCEAYCDDVFHIEECVAFAEKTGMMSKSEVEEAKKVNQALKNGAQLPGNCRNKKQCDSYCESPDHMEECIAFGQKTGMMSAEDQRDAEKVLQAIRKGVKPPPCRGKQQCDVYCQEPDHFDSCVSFAEAAGFMTPQDAEMARKTGGKGPGGCRGKECEGFCDNPNNQQICVEFAVEHGLLSQEQIQQMEQGKQQVQEALRSAPPEVLQCIKNAVGSDKVEKLQQGILSPDRAMSEPMKKCFEQQVPRRESEQGQFQSERQGDQSSNFTGPGGCRNEQECKDFCIKNPTACSQFRPETPLMQVPHMELEQRTKMNGPIQNGEMRGEFREEMMQQQIQPSQGEFQQMYNQEQEGAGERIQQIMPPADMIQQIPQEIRGSEPGSYKAKSTSIGAILKLLLSNVLLVR